MFAHFALSLLLSLRLVAGHQAFWHPSMFGFNVTQQTFSYDNRPVVPMVKWSFSKWWFHGHLNYPPHPEDAFELPAGQPATAQIACNKGATTYYASSEGGNVQLQDDPNNPCPNSPTSEFHTTGEDDVKGCALAIAYKSNVSEVQPEDFSVFSVNQTCVWNRYTDFHVPARMPACPNDMCICAFFWIHSPDSGSEQNYMNGFQCRVTNATSSSPVATSKVARRCGADPSQGRPYPDPGNCTYGAKQPFYWLQAEENNMFEGYYSPPFYNNLYSFLDGAQDDIFTDSYTSIPSPGPNQTALPVLRDPAECPAVASFLANTTASSSLSGSSLPISTPSVASSSGTATPTNPPPTGLTSNPSSTTSARPAPSGSVSPSDTSAAPKSGNTTPTASATPSSSPSQCSGKGNTSAFSRRHGSAKRGSSSWVHKRGH